VNEETLKLKPVKCSMIGEAKTLNLSSNQMLIATQISIVCLTKFN